MALTKKQLKDVCVQYGGHLQCRYLAEDFNAKGEVVYVCCKKNAAYKKITDTKVSEFLDDMKFRGVDPSTSNLPISDNCVGYVALKETPQGYDVK